MSVDQFLRTLWRRKLIVLMTVVLATATTYVLARTAPKVYAATATLFVGDRSAAADNFQALQSSQALAKTYAELIQSRNVADRVATALGRGQRGDDLLQDVAFQPITDTQLLSITAEADSARGAAVLANQYARTFIDYAKTNLASQTKSDISLVDPAQQPTGAIRPRPALYSAVALLIGLFLGCGLALVRDQFDRGVGEDEELQRLLGAPVLARVPSVSPRRLEGAREDQYLEAFRILRVNLSYVAPSRTVRSILVTSAESGEGKTTSALALARVLGEQGQQVLIIEGDLRRPSLGQALDVDLERPGFAQLIADEARLTDVAYPTAIANVSVVPAGTHAPSPASLLQPERLGQIMDEALEWAEFIIVDSPPLSAGADASVLAHAVGDVLFLVNSQRSRRGKAVAAVGQLRQAGARVTGLIVNGVSESADYGGYGYGEHARRGRNRLAEELATPAEH
jgi:capsular exopolysaccharide synthesis family protein